VGGLNRLLPKEIRSRNMIDPQEISSNWFKTEILKRSRKRRPCILRFALQRQGHQSIQSARLSFQSSELGPPAPTRKGMLLPPPFGSKGGDTLACGMGVGRGSNSDEGTDTVVLLLKSMDKVYICSLATTTLFSIIFLFT
jgi:hypothetical protein